MSDLDLTEAVDAAAEAWLQLSFPDWQGASPYTQNALRKIMLPPIATAAPFIERCVRERVAADIEALVPDSSEGHEQRTREAALNDAARIARGEATA